MLKECLSINLIEAMSCFRLENQQLIRISDEKRWNGLDCTNQKMVRVGNLRHKTLRVIYALLHGVNPQGRVMLDDDGSLVDVIDNHFYLILTKKHLPKVMRLSEKQKNQPKPYLARYVDKQGNRMGKAFKTTEEGKEWQQSMTKEEWLGIAEGYNMVKKADMV